MKGLGILVLIVVVAAFFMPASGTVPTFKPCADPAGCAEANKTAYAAKPVPALPRPTVDKSPAAQAKREKLIQNLIAHRVFTKTGVPGNLPRVWVGPAFNTLDFDDKRRFVSVVSAYYFDEARGDGMVRVFDGRTNKPVGIFTTAGLSLD